VQFEPSRWLNGKTSGEKSTLDLPRTQATAQRSSIAVFTVTLWEIAMLVSKGRLLFVTARHLGATLVMQDKLILTYSQSGWLKIQHAED